MKNKIVYIFIALLLIGCNREIFNIKTKACFDYSSHIELKTSDTIKFSNCSENSNYYFWDFGDGSTSTEVNPKHVYNSAGLFTVKLIASSESKSDSIIKIINVDDIVSLNKTMSALYGPNELSIDVDGNKLVDFQIYKSSHTGTTSQFYCTIKTFNGYEIFSDSIFTDCKNTSMPKMYFFGDTIQNSTQTQTQTTIYLYYYFLNYVTKPPCENDSWIRDVIRYVGFRKQSGNRVKLGWIKLKVSGASTQATVTLYSFKIPLETDILLIDK
jgi:hypothetical protein